jgi:hypothetical protein
MLGNRKIFVRISSYDRLSRLDLAHYVKEEEWHNVTRRASNWPKEAKNLTQLPDSEDESKSEEINLCLPVCMRILLSFHLCLWCDSRRLTFLLLVCHSVASFSVFFAANKTCRACASRGKPRGSVDKRVVSWSFASP